MSTIRIVCPKCEAVYHVPAEKIIEDTVKATCKVCKAPIEVDKTGKAVEQFQDDRPTTRQAAQIPEITRNPQEKPSSTWQKAIIDNAESDALLDSVESVTEAAAPYNHQETPLEPSSSLGGHPRAENPASANKSKMAGPQRLRRSRGRVWLLMVLLVVASVAAVYLLREQIQALL